MGWKDRFKVKKKSFSTKNIAKAVDPTFGQASALRKSGGRAVDDITGQTATDRLKRSQRRASGALIDRINEGRDLSDASFDENLGILNQYTDEQRQALENSYRQAGIDDQAALDQAMGLYRDNQGQISDLLSPQAQLQGQFMGDVADASTMAGMDRRFSDIAGGEQYQALMDERGRAATNALSDSGLRRSSAAGETFADLSADTIRDLEQQQYRRAGGMLEMGNQGTNNLANFLNRSNTGMADLGFRGQNAINDRQFQGRNDIADILANRGANEIRMRDSNTANQMNLIGQQGQAQTASILGQANADFNQSQSINNLIGQGIGAVGGAMLGPIGAGIGGQLGGMFSGGGAGGGGNFNLNSGSFNFDPTFGGRYY